MPLLPLEKALGSAPPIVYIGAFSLWIEYDIACKVPITWLPNTAFISTPEKLL
jgi:hypothetical protein